MDTLEKLKLKNEMAEDNRLGYDAKKTTLNKNLTSKFRNWVQ